MCLLWPLSFVKQLATVTAQIAITPFLTTVLSKLCTKNIVIPIMVCVHACQHNPQYAIRKFTASPAKMTARNHEVSVYQDPPPIYTQQPFPLHNLYAINCQMSVSIISKARVCLLPLQQSNVQGYTNVLVPQHSLHQADRRKLQA